MTTHGTRAPHPTPPPATVRLDKWLWAARFYKHRSAATEAVDGGKVRLNQAPAKPARPVKIGDQIDITQGEDTRTVVIQALADKRGPAPVAQTLYTETAESLARRETARQQRQLAPVPGSDRTGRPTKRDRRQIHRLIQH